MLIYFGIEITEVGVVWNEREIKVSVLDTLTLKSIFDVQVEMSNSQLVYKSDYQGSGIGLVVIHMGPYAEPDEISKGKNKGRRKEES